MQKQVTPPYDLDIEESLLSTLFKDSEALFDCDGLFPSDFYIPDNQKIFAEIVSLNSVNQPVSTLVVSQSLKNQVSVTIIAKVDSAPIAVDVAYYSQKLQELKKLRNLLTVSYRIQKNIAETPDEAVNIAQKDLLNLDADRIQNTVYQINTEKFIERIEKKEKKSSFYTGLYDVDKNINIKRGHLFVLAGRPSIGKSVAGLNIAMSFTKKCEKNVLLFSLEMTRAEIEDRIISSELGILYDNIIKKRLEKNELEKIKSKREMLNNLTLFIDDSSRKSIFDIVRSVQKIKAKFGVDAVIIDYLTLMQTDKKAQTRDIAIGEITRALKICAKELNIVVILLAQLNREVEKRADKKPQLSDLRESGSIEQDADIVVLLHRPEIYPDYLKRNPDVKGLSEWHIVKNRTGKTKAIRLGFQGFYQRFINLKEDFANWDDNLF